MSSQRVRVMVGEGRSARKGLLRFVLENEGYDVVAEAESTFELAQKLVVYRPDVVVLDDGIDASAVGMMREVFPQAKVILVWPRGVSAVGADARLEPAEVLSSLGPTVARVIGRGPVLAPPRPRVPPSDVVVVPEAEPVSVPEPAPTQAVGAEAGGGIPVGEATPAVAPPAEPPVPTEPVAEVPEVMSNVVMPPAAIEAPRWTYTAVGATPAKTDRRGWIWAAVAIIAVAAAFVVGAVLTADRTVAVVGVSGSVDGFTLPGTGGGAGEGTSDQPGTYRGIVRVHADGTIRLSATGDLRLRLDGLMRIVATGHVQVRGSGVVKSVTSSGVRVHGTGGILIVMNNGHIHLRLQGTLSGRGRGTVRISGLGRLLIHHRPL